MTDAPVPTIRTPLGDALVTADAVAEFLQIDRATVFRLAGRELPVVEIGGRVKRFRVADVRAYVERKTRCSAPRDRVQTLLRRGPRGGRFPVANDVDASARKSVHPKHESRALPGTAEDPR